MYLFDTDISIYLLNGRLPWVAERLNGMSAGQLGTTTVTAAELRFGALNSGRPAENLARVASFLEPLTQVPFDEEAAIQFSNVRRFLVAKGQLIGLMDLLIASCTLAAGGILVTNNVREFSRVPSLKVENWSA